MLTSYDAENMVMDHWRNKSKGKQQNTKYRKCLDVNGRHTGTRKDAAATVYCDDDDVPPRGLPRGDRSCLLNDTGETVEHSRGSRFCFKRRTGDGMMNFSYIFIVLFVAAIINQKKMRGTKIDDDRVRLFPQTDKK